VITQAPSPLRVETQDVPLVRKSTQVEPDSFVRQASPPAQIGISFNDNFSNHPAGSNILKEKGFSFYLDGLVKLDKMHDHAELLFTMQRNGRVASQGHPQVIVTDR